MNRILFFAFGEWTRARIVALVLGVSDIVLSYIQGLVAEPARAYVGVAEVSAFLATALAVVWYVSRRDEFIRRYWSLAAVFGFVVGVITLSVLDVLRAAGMYHGTLSNPRRVFLLPFAAALAFFALRYRWCRYDE
jgi:hypothetical protein